MPSIRPAIIAWTYEADTHCVDCAYERFGDTLGAVDALDREGNEPQPVFSGDEWWEPSDPYCQTLHCGDCGHEMAHLCGEAREEEAEYDDDETATCGCDDCVAAEQYTGGDC
jgi:hypothetical protein